jgi:hypothetical protein
MSDALPDPKRDTRHDIQHDTFDEWPAALRSLFDGASIETKTGFTASLLAADEAGIRTSLLSVGELFAPDTRTLCFSLWPQSRAAKVISKTGRATLTFVFDEAFFQVQLQARSTRISKSAPRDNELLTYFIATIETGEWQRVSYARLTSGIEFELEGREAVLARWRGQVETLKRVASAAA